MKAPACDFRSDPLRWLDDAARDSRGFRWISRRRVCIYDGNTARALLRNDRNRLVETSDFFGTGPRSLSPRAAQIAVARECHALIQQHAQAIDWSAAAATVGSETAWPAAGNALLMEIMRPVLAAPWRSPAFHRAVESMVTARIFARHEAPRGSIRRTIDRFRFFRAIAAEATLRAHPSAAPDVLEIIHRNQPAMDPETLVQLYAGFVFAVVGSIGFALGWALLLAGRERQTEHLPAHIVMEALRLYPVAWMFTRHLQEPGQILGEHVSPEQELVICPYAVHRNPAYWSEPMRFSPDRWARKQDRSAWIPFGAGAHGCVAAGFSVNVASKLLAELLRDPVEVVQGNGGPSLGAALAPPRFLLKRSRG